MSVTLCQNGYPSRRRSLVGDARFETQINKENKRSWLQEIRQLSRDSELSEDDLILVDDDTIIVSPTLEEEPFEETAEEADNSSLGSVAPVVVQDKKDGAIGKQRKKSTEEKEPEEATIVLTLKNAMVSLVSILKTIDVSLKR